MRCSVLAISTMLVCSLGCDAIVYTAQPLQLRVLDRSSTKLLAGAQVCVAPINWSDRNQQPPDDWIDRYASYWDAATAEANTARTGTDGTARLLVNTGTVLRSWLPEPLPDQLTGTEFFVRVRAAGISEILRVQMANNATGVGRDFLLRVERIGRPREVRFREPTGQRPMATR